MYDLIRKVLDEMRMNKKDRVRHSDSAHTVVAYKCLNRQNDMAYLRIDIYNVADLKRKTARGST